MTAVALLVLVALSLAPQTRWRLPVTIKVTQDVSVEPYPHNPPKGRRGVLYVGRLEKVFQIKSGQTFQMVNAPRDSEGGCRIRFDKKEYEVLSCWWLDGFTDPQEDIFVVSRK